MFNEYKVPRSNVLSSSIFAIMAQCATLPLAIELLDEQLSIIGLIEGMFPSPGELDISDSTSKTLAALREVCASNGQPSADIVPSSVTFGVNLRIDGVSSTDHTILMNIIVPLHSVGIKCMTVMEAPSLRYALRQPSWMSKAELSELSKEMLTDDVFEAFDYVREGGAKFLEESRCASEAAAAESPSNEQMVRVWFYFPSLSTRSKRDDLVNNAPAYGLSGFVLAGKPGVLCLEGYSTRIDQYMKFIKTDSWGDIPSYQKKVSERHREADNVTRVFDGMVEITGTLGERGGQRANRGDMQALELWLRDKGLADAFEKVIF